MNVFVFSDIRIDVMPKEDATKFEFTPGNQRGASSGDSMRDQVVLEKATVDALGESESPQVKEKFGESSVLPTKGNN